MKTDLEQAVAAAVKELFGTEVHVDLTRPDEQFGDYATNVALQLAKPVGKNPPEIAEALKEKLSADERLRSVEVAGPGFLNLTLKDDALAAGLATKSTRTLDGQTIVVEYSDPNPFKVLHAGHLYTSVVGNAVANLLEHAGASIKRINFGGDVGLHVGKTMWAISKELGGFDLEKFRGVFANKSEDYDFRFGWLSSRYVEGNNAYEDDPSAKQSIIELNKRVYQIHEQDDHESADAQIYWTCRDWSYDYFKYFYRTIQVHEFDRFLPESETAPVGLRVVREQQQRGVYQESDGAVIFDGEPYGLHPRVFINSSGLPTYEAKDVGLLMVKWRDYHFDQSVIITGNDIVEYMKVVLKSVEQFEPEPAERTRHITHGQVKLAGGIKMSSRKGNVLGALEIIEAGSAAAREYAAQNNQEFQDGMVYDAFKYAFLKYRIGADVIYDPQEAVALEGNSGPYLQYAHARARSVLAKAAAEQTETALADLTADERSLLRKITEFTEVVDKAVAELMPHHICTYLYELAQKFNQFYEHNRVIGDEREAARLRLVRHYADTLKSGLELLGIAAPDHM